MVMFSKQGSKGQSWHQDCPPEDTSRFNLNRLVYSMDIDASIGGETLVGTWVASDGGLSALAMVMRCLLVRLH